jgi:N-acetyl sugar amidotransferase
MKYCVNCVLPDTKPDLYFDESGVCSACTSYLKRNSIDWIDREQQLLNIIDKYRAGKHNLWDCIVPVSGGKDSTLQVLKVLELGLKPLCVTSTTCDLSEIGRKNINNIKQLGVDHLEFSPNPKIRAKLNRVGLELVGDISWPEHVGIFTIPVRAAVQFKVPLIVWGENSQNEYGGPATAAEKSVLDRRWLEEFGGLLGLRVSDLIVNYGFTESELIPYLYPSDKELAEVGVSGIFLGHYYQWDGMINYFLAQANGFTSLGKVVEGSIVDYENLDNYQTGIHDYFKFLKFGFGRTSDIVSLFIRRNRITRSQGLQLVKLHDGKYPWTYLGKSLEEIIKPLGLSVEEFNTICDRFTNGNIFIKSQSGDYLRDKNFNLIKKNYDN